MGGECWINNLHFHLVNTDTIFSSGRSTVTTFPIEKTNTRVFLESTLNHLDESEINMFKVGVTFFETTEWPIPAFVIKPIATEG